MKVEQATAASIGEWGALRAKLWPHASRQELEREASALLARGRAAAFLLRAETEAAGFAEATVRVDYVNGCSTSPVAFLEGIYVEPEWRRCGGARLLCQAVEGWAKEQGCSEFASDADIGNEASHAMHQALGFAETERVVYFHKRIG